MRSSLRDFLLHLAAAALLCLPVWTTPFFITQDGPAHLYDAKLIVEHFDPQNTTVLQHYIPEFHRTSNWVCQGLIAVLQGPFGYDHADRIVISLGMVLIAGGLAFWSRRVHGGFHVAELLGYLFGYSYIALTGLYNFMIGLGLSFFMAGWWWTRRNRPRAVDWAVLSVFAAALYVTHLIALAFLVSIIAVQLALDLWRSRRTAVIPAAVFLAVCTAAAVGYTLAEDVLKFEFQPVANWIVYAAQARYLDTFTSFGLRGILFTCWLIAVVMSAVAALWTPPKNEDGRRDGRLLLTFLAILWTGIFLFAPWRYWKDSRNYGSMVNERLPLIFAALWVLALDRSDRVWRSLSAVFLGGMVIWQTTVATLEMRKVQPQITEFLSGMEALQPHSVFRLEVNKVDYLDAFPEDFSDLEIFGKLMFRYGLAAEDLVCAGIDGHSVDPAWPHHFLIKKEPQPKADYVIVWNSKTRAKRLEESGHGLIFHNRRLRVYESPEAGDNALETIQTRAILDKSNKK